uniref:Vitamin K-dependent protein S n=1 Tax=Chelonoidis abingdonii TaxID=106734 RepID=A0A8C0H9T3_CHEAB
MGRSTTLLLMHHITCALLLFCLALYNVNNVLFYKVLSQQYASEFLVRKRRANSFMEESKKGNLERECIEELCNKEEAREIFENNPETEYFYPKYLSKYQSPSTHKKHTSLRRSVKINFFPPDLFPSAHTEISNQCSPLPCNEDGYMECIDGQARYTCVCKPGWQGERCEEDRDECTIHPNICGTAQCKNSPGKYKCECAEGYTYNSTSKNCEDVDECAENTCAQECVNSPGSYACYCDGKKGFKLSKDRKHCEAIPVCVPLNLERNYELLYLAEQFIAIPVLYLRFRLPEVTRFSAEFDFRTYDTEGVILYAESSDSTAWFLLALRDGKIEIQFKNELGTKVTSGGKAINDGLWHIVSVEELEHSISVKIAKEAVMNINSPRSLFKPSNGFLETKVYIAGLPRKVGDTLIKPLNPRLDGCIRAWNLMNQGSSGIKEVIQEKQSKHCLVTVGKGSYYPGTGMAQFHINYNNFTNDKEWLINITLTIRPSTGTGVMFALVSGKTVPLALSIVDSNSPNSQEIIVTIENVIVARLESERLCTSKRMLLGLRVNKQLLELTADSQTQNINSEQEQQLSILDQVMKGPIVTYLGGIPDVPVGATLLTAFYNGCMEVKVNDIQLDLDEAFSKHNDIRSHSCPLIANEMNEFLN